MGPTELLDALALACTGACDRGPAGLTTGYAAHVIFLAPSPTARAWRAALGAVALLTLSTAAHAGVTFHDGALDKVLQRAAGEKKLVMVEVFASWCGPCRRQAAEVFDADDGVLLTKGLLAWRVDFDAPEQRVLMEKWNVLSLPTVLVLRPDGSEVDRVEGYESKDAFLVEARALAKGVDSLPALEARLARASDYAERMRLTVEVGHRKLVRGDAEGLRMLERAMVSPLAHMAPAPGGEPQASAAEDALFLVGRYHARVRRDFAVARHVWRELYTRFPAGPYADTAAWWYAGALHETGDDVLALSFLEQRARTFDKSALAALVDFAVDKATPSSGFDAKAVARRVLTDAHKARALEDAAHAALRAKLDTPSAPPKS